MTEQLAPPQPPAAKRPCCAVETAAAAAGAASGQSAVDVPVQPVPPQTPPGKRQRQVCQQGVSIAEPAADEDVAAAAEAEVTAATAAAADAPAGSGAEVRRNQCPLPLRYLRGRDTGWQPRDTKPALNVRLDGRIVQSAAGGARISYSHVVVLDDFIDEATRAALLAFLTTPADSEADSGAEAATAATAAADGSERATAEGAPAAHEPAALPGDKWERRTADQAGLAATWGVKEHVLRELAHGELLAVQEVHARLQRLYPDVDIAHMPSDLIQGKSPQHPPDATAVEARAAADEGANSAGGPASREADCDQFVANAAVAGDSFAWHIDADPAGVPASRWSEQFGDYCNGEPGRPLFVSLILYLDDEWQRDWDAETLFLDAMTDVGIVVRPKRCRAILMDQDVLHRLSAPSPAANRPRFSLVWKLVFVPRSAGQTACLARPEWGIPTSFASAARLDAVRRAVLSQQQ